MLRKYSFTSSRTKIFSSSAFSSSSLLVNQHRYFSVDLQQRKVEMEQLRDLAVNTNTNSNSNSNNNNNSSGSENTKPQVQFFPNSQFLILPNTAGAGNEKVETRKILTQHESLKEIINRFPQITTAADSVVAPERIAIFGQDTGNFVLRLSQQLALKEENLKNQNPMTNNDNSSNNSNSNIEVIVVDRMLEKLVLMAQQIPQLVQDKFLFIKSVDPYFSLLHCCPDGILNRICVNYPPPFPSDPESYRRIVNHHFLTLSHQKLVRGGDIIVTTDFLPLHRFHEQQTTISQSMISWSLNFQTITTTNKTKNINNKNISSSNNDDEQHSILGNVSVPSLLEDAPPRIRFQHSSSSSTNDNNEFSKKIHIMRRVKDMPTPDFVIAHNVSHITKRKKFGALVRN